jgi:lipoate-protein ligase A
MVVWRLIELEGHDAYFNMAADEAIGKEILERRARPTIRFYTWKPCAVSIGHFQSMRDEIDVEKCKELGIDYIRRKTGGGAVYHDEKGELTYSVIAPQELFPKGILESYKAICGWVVDALRALGMDANFAPINDIVVEGKKISGNAQSRSGGILLQHGTILYDLNLEKMFSVLKISKEKIADKMIKDARMRVTCVREHAAIDRGALYRALLDGFTNGKECEAGALSVGELRIIEELERTEYKTDSWNFMR